MASDMSVTPWQIPPRFEPRQLSFSGTVRIPKHIEYADHPHGLQIYCYDNNPSRDAPDVAFLLKANSLLPWLAAFPEQRCPFSTLQKLTIRIDAIMVVLLGMYNPEGSSIHWHCQSGT